MATILIVEDDPLIALGLAQLILDEVGAQPVIASSLAEADRAISGRRVDMALLDVNLRGERSFPAARRLQSNGIPFAFVSASPLSDVPEDLRGACFLAKPCRARDIATAVKSVLEDWPTNLWR